jgi:hypothetical protein
MHTIIMYCKRKTRAVGVVARTAATVLGAHEPNTFARVIRRRCILVNNTIVTVIVIPIGCPAIQHSVVGEDLELRGLNGHFSNFLKHPL